LQSGSCLLLFLGKQVQRKGTTEDIGLGHPFGSGKGLNALVDLIAEADLKTGGGYGDTGIDTAILR
jgi:hypothetical protein